MNKIMSFVKEVKDNKTVRKIVNYISNVLIVLLIVIVGFSVYGNIQTKGKAFRAPSVGPYMWMSVLSNSMKPVFSTGDLIVDKKVDVSELKVGDIVTFTWGTSLSTHRITEVIKNEKGNISFKTKGDSNNAVDIEPVTSNRVVGKYMFKIPLIGYIFTKLRGLVGVILIWIMFFAVVGTEVYKNIKNSRKKKKENTVTE